MRLSPVQCWVAKMTIQSAKRLPTPPPSVLHAAVPRHPKSTPRCTEVPVPVGRHMIWWSSPRDCQMIPEHRGVEWAAFASKPRSTRQTPREPAPRIPRSNRGERAFFTAWCWLFRRSGSQMRACCRIVRPCCALGRSEASAVMHLAAGTYSVSIAPATSATRIDQNDFFTLIHTDNY